MVSPLLLWPLLKVTTTLLQKRRTTKRMRRNLKDLIPSWRKSLVSQLRRAQTIPLLSAERCVQEDDADGTMWLMDSMEEFIRATRHLRLWSSSVPQITAGALMHEWQVQGVHGGCGFRGTG